MTERIWFWQRIVSPHMAGLASALAARGVDVTYVAERRMSSERAAQGWAVPDLGSVKLRVASTTAAVTGLVAQAPDDSIHLCQGLRGNGLVTVAQAALARRGLRQMAVMEGVDDQGWGGGLRRYCYRRILRDRALAADEIIAIGHKTPGWLIRQGWPADRIAPFAYFLSDPPPIVETVSESSSPFRFLFVGQFVRRKRLDLLIEALSRLRESAFELVVVGSGPLERPWLNWAQAELGGRVSWLGQCPQTMVATTMASCDCLVLPSRHDGWGAVISEALMVGTPAVCSDSCGAAEVVKASGCGGVFANGNAEALAGVLEGVLEKCPRSRRARSALAAWAKCLAAPAGAEYLLSILHRGNRSIGPPPWLSPTLNALDPSARISG